MGVVFSAGGPACRSNDVQIVDLHSDFRDIWAGRETLETGKQAEPEAPVVIDFNTTVDPARVTAQFVPADTNKPCGSAIAATVFGSFVAPNIWGKATSNSARPSVPAPYNLFARKSVSGAINAQGALAAGGEVPGAGSQQRFDLETAFQNLETLARLLNEAPATGSAVSIDDGQKTTILSIANGRASQRTGPVTSETNGLFYATSPRRETLTAWILSASGKVSFPAWTTSSESSFRSCRATRIEGVTRGETVRLISKPFRRPFATTSRSNSAPAWVAQK